MKYLSNAVDFTIKNWILIIPLFVLLAISALIRGAGEAAGLASILSLADVNNFTSAESLFKTIPTILALTVGSGIVAFFARFIYEPATYGLINKRLETGSATLNDIGAAISDNFVKFIMYFVGTLVVNLVIGIAGVLIMLLMVLLVSLLKGFGIALMFIVLIALALFVVAFGALTSLWFPSMVVDGLDVFAAFKKSIEIVRSCFWTVLGITVLDGIVAGIASSILGFFGRIPLLGVIILSAIPTIQHFVMAVFSMMIYREKTGRAVA